MERSWQKLVRELRDEGYDSPYLERLRRRLDVYEAQEQLEKEVVREMAAALGRTEEKLLVALLRLELAGREVDAARDDRDRRRCIARFNAAREEALSARYELLVHREAIGFRRNQILETMYPVPPRR
ncbi:MAG TPA: hypothetical protein VFD92_04365 [Candidatus Binatia bacterium]|nr:hypothetical protein [Candidatus Binatia bacterium]